MFLTLNNSEIENEIILPLRLLNAMKIAPEQNSNSIAMRISVIVYRRRETEEEVLKDVQIALDIALMSIRKKIVIP